MKKLLKDRKMIFILLLIFVAAGIANVMGTRFFHGELMRQIDETLELQADQILQGYATYDQNREILRAGIQADALELNRIHGEFLLKTIEQAHREHLRGSLDRRRMEERIASILEHSEERANLSGVLIPQASSHRNDLDQLIRSFVQKPQQVVSYLGNQPSEVFHTGYLDIIIRGGLEQPWETYARAVYYQPLDMIVIFQGTSSYAEDNVGRLFRSNQETLERNIMLAGSLEDVIILQKNGYSLYSGRFENDNPNRVTRILYTDMDAPDGLGKELVGSSGMFKTVSIPTPGQQHQERYGYVLYDSRQDQYVFVSRLTADIVGRERALDAVSRMVGIVNVVVICIIAGMLISRDDALKEEESP